MEYTPGKQIRDPIRNQANMNYQSNKESDAKDAQSASTINVDSNLASNPQFDIRSTISSFKI